MTTLQNSFVQDAKRFDYQTSKESQELAPTVVAFACVSSQFAQAFFHFTSETAKTYNTNVLNADHM